MKIDGVPVRIAIVSDHTRNWQALYVNDEFRACDSAVYAYDVARAANGHICEVLFFEIVSLDNNWRFPAKLEKCMSWLKKDEQ